MTSGATTMFLLSFWLKKTRNFRQYEHYYFLNISYRAELLLLDHRKFPKMDRSNLGESFGTHVPTSNFEN